MIAEALKYTRTPIIILSSDEAQAPRGRGPASFAFPFAGESGSVRGRFRAGCSIGGVSARSFRLDVDELGSLFVSESTASVVVSLSWVVSAAVVSKDSSQALMRLRSSHSL